MFCIKIYFLEPEPVGAEVLWVEPEPKKNSWSRSRGNMARLLNTAVVNKHLNSLICNAVWARDSFFSFGTMTM